MTLAELEKQNPVNITVLVASQIMGVTPQFLRAALLQGKLNFGVGVSMEKNNEFYINTMRFIKYMKGEL